VLKQAKMRIDAKAFNLKQASQIGNIIDLGGFK
jgi:hypothetical protein